MSNSILGWLLIGWFLAVVSGPDRISARQNPDSRAQTKPPNVLWLMSDEHRTDSLGCYGSLWASTPNLDRLAREGVRFVSAVTPAPVCVPARSAILTGRYPSALGIWHNVRPAQHSMPEFLSEAFHRAGYRSASFGKQHYGGTKKAFQTEASIVLSEAVGYFKYLEPYDSAQYDVVRYPPSPYGWILGGRFPAPVEKTAQARIVRESLAWLDKLDRGTPFFLRLSFNAPHTPVVPPAPYDRKIDPDAIRLPPAAEGRPPGEAGWIAAGVRPSSEGARLSPDEVRKARRYYYGEVAFLDNQIGEMLSAMRSRGLLDNTIVAFVSDHGTHVGDYSLVQKQTFYEPVVNVPYIFWYPKGIAKGVVIQTPVETRTLLPTLFELAGISFVAEAGIAQSLAASLREGREPTAQPVFSEFNLASFGMPADHRYTMIRDGRWKLSLAFTPEPGDGALYDLIADPYERVNLYGSPEATAVRERLSRLLREHLAAK
jgi:arylsulfatase A-like enzyme